MEIGEIIGYNLKKLRAEKNLSLGQLAERAGVSKVILSQIEKGDSNPTVNTIWKITGALGLPYTSLLEAPFTAAEHVSKGDITELVEDKYHIFNYYAKSDRRNFEMYQIEMEPGCDHRSIGHSSSSYEYIMILEGEMILTEGDTEHLLKRDDALCFNAAGPHRYRNEGKETVKAALVVQYT